MKAFRRLEMFSSRSFCGLLVSAFDTGMVRSTAEEPRTRRLRRGKTLLALLVSVTIFTQSFGPTRACGPESIEPIFVFTSSPDLPFDEFARGKIGILQPTLGGKSLVIAYRYLNGGTFTEDEQKGLVDALKGKSPETNDDVAIKAWIAARKEVVGEEAAAPSIYDERRHSGYDFFPNCTSNAFEVATQTLKDRISSYGANDPNVHDWLRAQDVVFQNCAEGATAPAPAGPGSPRWLKKDRDYQTAAAYFYSLNLNEARKRFEQIAEDNDSDWSELARYLVGRTLVRQASLTKAKEEKQVLYGQAEAELINAMARSGKYLNASKRLLGLIKYRLHPQERIRELAQVLAEQGGNVNIKQDLIDYKWLLDKFETQAQKEEAERKRQSDPTPTPTPFQPNAEFQKRYEAVQRGELIEVYFTPRNSDGELDFSNSQNLAVKYDVTEQEVLQQIEINLGRKLSADETKDLQERYDGALSHRQWLLSPNRQWDQAEDSEGYDSNFNDLPLASLPLFLTNDSLSDWIVTFQSNDPKSYNLARAHWRETQSPAWLLVALSKANSTSPYLARLLRDAEKIEPASPSFPTIAYNLVRLQLELKRPAEAKKILDRVVATRFDSLPISSQNLLLKQRIIFAPSISAFLQDSGLKPVAFFDEGTFGRISDIVQMQKGFWELAYTKETKEEFDGQIDENFKELLLWDERKTFDTDIADILNWHFPVATLLDASRDPALPDYLRRLIAPTVWTRAVLLNNEKVAREVSTDVASYYPAMDPLLKSYLEAKTPVARETEALYLLLKFSNLSPWVVRGLPENDPGKTAEQQEYFFELSWWCKPYDVEYRMDGTEVPKTVPAPTFLNPQILATARREHAALIAIGDAKSYLGKRVLEWARRSPKDPRIPEALYIAAQANQSYKYGCGGWEEDEETRAKLESWLKEKYPQTIWAAKLDETER